LVHSTFRLNLGILYGAHNLIKITFIIKERLIYLKSSMIILKIRYKEIIIN